MWSYYLLIIISVVMFGGGFGLQDLYRRMRGSGIRISMESTCVGALAGLVLHWPAFWIYFFLKIDQVIKCVWCYFRLRSGKWLKKIKKAGE